MGKPPWGGSPFPPGAWPPPGKPPACPPASAFGPPCRVPPKPPRPPPGPPPKPPLPVDGPAVGLVPPIPPPPGPPPADAGSATAYAAGPARAATTAAATDAVNSRARLAEPTRARSPERKTIRPTMASAMTTARAGHSQPFQSAARRSRTTAQIAVTARPAGQHPHPAGVLAAEGAQQQDPAPCGQGRDTGSERGRVVGVHGALGHAERQIVQDRPAAPQHQRGARRIGARRPSAQHQAAHEGDTRERQQPGDLAAEDVVEHPAEARGTGEGAASATPAASAVALAAQHPAQAVVPHDQVPGGAVRGAPDVRAVAGRYE